MLESLDVLVGFVVVMLVVSMAVTMITQFLITVPRNLRGHALHEGLSHLLALMDHGLSREQAAQIADHILRNPLVGSAPLFGGRFGLATVIHREELTKLLIDFAIPGPADTANPDPAKEELRAAFKASLERNGITNPEGVLRQVRMTVVELEKTNPELSHSIRANLALLNCASSDFLSKLNSWFDQTVERASEIFTRRVRLVTGIVALIVAVVLQLDAVGLINRLSVDAELRNNLVHTATSEQEALKGRVESLQRRSDALANETSAAGNSAGGNASTATTDAANEVAGGNASDGNVSASGNMAGGGASDCTSPAASNGPDGNSVTALPVAAENCPPRATTEDDQLRQARHMIEELGVVSIPGGVSGWLNSWSAPPPGHYDDRLPRVFGILLAAALLSLGAPFWYAMLANLLKLRSVIAGKDEAQRTERQTTQESGSLTRPIEMTPAPPLPPAPPAPPEAEAPPEAPEAQG